MIAKFGLKKRDIQSTFRYL